MSAYPLAQKPIAFVSDAGTIEWHIFSLIKKHTMHWWKILIYIRLGWLFFEFIKYTITTLLSYHLKFQANLLQLVYRTFTLEIELDH